MFGTVSEEGRVSLEGLDDVTRAVVVEWCHQLYNTVLAILLLLAVLGFVESVGVE